MNNDRLGLVAVQLALSFPEWVRRRRFVLEYVDDTTVRRRMSVDYSLPAPDWFWIAPREGDQVYVPIYIAAKETLDGFTVYDASGARLTMLPTSDNGALAIAGLSAIIRGVDSKSSLEPDVIESELSRIVMARNEKNKTGVDVYDQVMAGPIGDLLPQEDEIRALLKDLATGFLMLVPVIYAPCRDQLIKAEWELQHAWNGPTFSLRRIVNSFFASIGWWDKISRHSGFQFGWSRSTHIELVTPPDVQMTSASLSVEQYDPEHDGLVKVDDYRRVFNKPRAALYASPRIPFDLDDHPNDRSVRLLQSRADTGSVKLKFRLIPSSVLLATLVASTAISGLLWFAREHLQSIDRQTFSGVLLVFPAILAAYLIRFGEHGYARRLLVGVRLCGLTVALCSLMTAASLGGSTISRNAPSGSHGSVQVTADCESAARVGRNEVAQLRCSVLSPDRKQVIDQGVKRWITALSIVATLLTATLLIGFLRTLVFSDLKTRHKGEGRRPFPRPSQL